MVVSLYIQGLKVVMHETFQLYYHFIFLFLCEEAG